MAEVFLTSMVIKRGISSRLIWKAQVKDWYEPMILEASDMALNDHFKR